MNIKTLTLGICLLILSLTACAAPTSASPTPTIVRLDPSALTPTAQAQAAESSPTATTIPLPSPTPAPVATTAPATATLQSELVATSSLTATAVPATAQVEIIAAGLNVREGPGVAYPVIGTVAKGDVLDITGVSANRNWLQIMTSNGTPGWISNQPDYLQVTGSLDNITVIEAPPAASSSPATGSAPVSPGPASSKLIFTTSSGGDLYSINIDGTGLQKLASGVIDPVVSPDGQQVAYTRWDAAEFGTLYVLNLDGSGERAVLNETRQAKSPAWSTDGQEIIVSYQRGGLRDPEVECRRFGFGEKIRIPENAQIVSTKVIGEKDTIEVCFIQAEDLQWGLRQVNLASGKFEDLPADLYSFNPTWDPQNPSRVIYDGQRGLMQLDIANGKLQPFTDDVRDTAPVFSPDGQKLAMTYKQHDHWEVYTYDLASGARQRLTKPPILADPQYNSAAPAWSPDGSQIAFLTDRSGQWEIWVMQADGSNPHPLVPPEVQAQWGLSYQGVNERMLNWVHSAATSTPAVTGASPAAASTPAALPASTSLSGNWDFSYGTMSLNQRDANVEGTYQWYGGVDTGQVRGILVEDLNQFQGIWISNRNPNSQSLIHWRLGTDRNNFSGNSEGGSTSEQWCGVRSGQPLPAGCGFSGVWQLRFGNPPGVTGQATLVQTGQTVQGTFVDSQGHTGEIIDGVITVPSITEAKLSGTWRNDKGEQDKFEWRLNLTNDQTFQGRRNPGNSEWCGWRAGTNEPEQCGW